MPLWNNDKNVMLVAGHRGAQRICFHKNSLLFVRIGLYTNHMYSAVFSDFLPGAVLPHRFPPLSRTGSGTAFPRVSAPGKARPGLPGRRD